MSKGETSKAERQKEVERAAAVGSGKPEGSLAKDKASLANASRETSVNGRKD